MEVKILKLINRKEEVVKFYKNFRNFICEDVGVYRYGIVFF